MVQSAENGDANNDMLPTKYANGIKSVFLNHEALISLKNSADNATIVHNIALPNNTPITCLNLDYINASELAQLLFFGIKRRVSNEIVADH